MKQLGKILLIIFIGANLLIFYYNIRYLRTESAASKTKSQQEDHKPQSTSTKPQGQAANQPGQAKLGKIIIRFDPSNTQLSQQSQEDLLKLFNVMSENPELKVRVIGYTDNQGNPLKNLKLSVK